VARQDANGQWVADPKTSLSFPIAGIYRGDEFILSGRNLELTFSFGDVPLQRFDMRGQLGRDYRVKPGASLYAEALCATVPNYGAELTVATRLCNSEGKLVASGTFVTQPYTTTTKSPWQATPPQMHAHPLLAGERASARRERVEARSGAADTNTGRLRNRPSSRSRAARATRRARTR